MDCKNCKGKHKCNLEEIRIVPFETEDEELRRLFSYFLYTAPNIESVHKTYISSDLHEKVYEEMMEGRNIEVDEFYSSNVRLEDKLLPYSLLGQEVCLLCKRIICKRKRFEIKKGESRESDLECLLRHLRNAIAHGRVYCFYRKGKRKWFLFEDANKENNTSARIVCLKEDLKQWKKVLAKNVLKLQHS